VYGPHAQPEIHRLSGYASAVGIIADRYRLVEMVAIRDHARRAKTGARADGRVRSCGGRVAAAVPGGQDSAGGLDDAVRGKMGLCG
jgi:hypothetical protein